MCCWITGGKLACLESGVPTHSIIKRFLWKSTWHEFDEDEIPPHVRPIFVIGEIAFTLDGPQWPVSAYLKDSSCCSMSRFLLRYSSASALLRSLFCAPTEVSKEGKESETKMTTGNKFNQIPTVRSTHLGSYGSSNGGPRTESQHPAGLQREKTLGQTEGGTQVG